MKRLFKILLIIAGVLITPVLLSPLPRFDEPLSTVVEAKDGSLLGARIADDGQWRFPAPEEVPEKFEKALLTFEDRYFYLHPGINPVSVIRAFVRNLRAGEVVSGGSTITMQLARLSRGNTSRTYAAKLAEALSALPGVPQTLPLLVRTRATEPQNQLKLQERIRNVKGAFSLDAGSRTDF